VKQNLKLTNYHGSPITFVLVMLAFTTFSCARVARESSSIAESPANVSTAERAALVNINTASPAELEQLPGVGKVIAERIVAQREQYGPFRRAEHLMMVRGISDRKFREIRSMILAE
jgi:competence protein ComEA